MRPLIINNDYYSEHIQRRDNIRDLTFEKLKQNEITPSELWELRTKFPYAMCLNVHLVCNEKCVMCPRAYHDVKKNSPIMSMDDYSKIISEFSSKGGRILVLNSFSEIFAVPEGVEYIKFVLENFPEIEMYIVSNGLAFKPDIFDKLINSGFEGKVVISLHGFNAETYKNITGLDGFEKVKSNIEYISKNHPHPERISITNICDWSNEEDISGIREFCNNLSINLAVINSHTFNGASKHKDSINHIDNNHVFAGCIAPVHDIGYPFYQMYIMPNGDSVLCCRDFLGNTILGNVLKENIEDVWNGSAYKKAINEIYFASPLNNNLICSQCEFVQTRERNI